MLVFDKSIETKICGIIVALFSGVGTILFFNQIFFNKGLLKLTSKGFEMKLAWPLKSKFFKWNDVENFKVVEISSQKMVCFNLKPYYAKQQILRDINANLTGYEDGLRDNYGMSYEKLADLMNKWRKKYSK